jgi:hypothetical protein
MLYDVSRHLKGELINLKLAGSALFRMRDVIYAKSWMWSRSFMPHGALSVR